MRVNNEIMEVKATDTVKQRLLRGTRKRMGFVENIFHEKESLQKLCDANKNYGIVGV